jgi:AcrR family transcriptional regulator
MTEVQQREVARAGGVDPQIVQAAIDEARDAGRDVSHLSLDRVARRAGVSRATLFRRIHGREALEEAVRRAGVEPGRRETVRGRALAAALELIEGGGLEALTVEEVARRAGCAVSSVHTQFGGRDGLLEAFFERYSPVVAVERVLAERPERFEDQVTAVYTTLFDGVVRRRGVAGALLADVFGRPDGPIAAFAQRTVVPRILARLGAWLDEESRRGSCRTLPAELSVPTLVGPLWAHLALRVAIEWGGGDPPDRELVIRTLAEAFCAAVRAPAGPRRPGAAG